MFFFNSGVIIKQNFQMANCQMPKDRSAALSNTFSEFCSATTMCQILEIYRSMCKEIILRPAPYNDFYPKLKSNLTGWKAKALWVKLDARASHSVYDKNSACAGTQVLIIGAGPCGLRTAIEAQLLGAKVVLIEKRNSFSRTAFVAIFSCRFA